MKRSTLNTFVNMKHKTKVVRVSAEDGGGFIATIPELGEDAFVADGTTKKEALKNLKELKRTLFADYLKNGIKIPESR